MQPNKDRDAGNYVGQWVERQSERTFQRQRAQVDTAKLLVTFSTAVAATLVAATLQIGSPSNWDTGAAALLGVSAVLALSVLSRDRLTEVDSREIQYRQISRGWGVEKTMEEIRVAVLTNSECNEEIVRSARTLMWIQFASAAVCGCLAIVGLFSGRT